MGSGERVVRVRSWGGLPETIPPGTYLIEGVRLEVRERVTKEEVRMAVSGVRRLADEYYG